MVNMLKGRKTTVAQWDGYRRPPRRALRTRGFIESSQPAGEVSESNEIHALLLLQVRSGLVTRASEIAASKWQSHRFNSVASFPAWVPKVFGA